LAGHRHITLHRRSGAQDDSQLKLTHISAGRPKLPLCRVLPKEGAPYFSCSVVACQQPIPLGGEFLSQPSRCLLSHEKPAIKLSRSGFSSFVWCRQLRGCKLR
jgi:hypothetical protein